MFCTALSVRVRLVIIDYCPLCMKILVYTYRKLCNICCQLVQVIPEEYVFIIRLCLGVRLSDSVAHMLLDESVMGILVLARSPKKHRYFATFHSANYCIFPVSIAMKNNCFNQNIIWGRTPSMYGVQLPLH